MKKPTLKFSSLERLCAFQRQHLPDAYFINTITLTLTGKISEHLLLVALAEYGAEEVLAAEVDLVGQMRRNESNAVVVQNNPANPLLPGRQWRQIYY